MAAQRRTQSPCQMRAAFAPVEAGLAERAGIPPASGEAVRRQPQPVQEIQAGRRHQTDTVIQFDMTMCLQRIGQRHTQRPGHMIVASACPAHRRIARAGDRAARRGGGKGRHLHDGFQQPRYLRRSQPVIAMPALAFHRQHPGLDQPGEMRAGTLRRHPGGTGQLARGQRAPVHQRHQHGGTGGLPHQQANFGDTVRVHDTLPAAGQTNMEERPTVRPGMNYLLGGRSRKVSARLPDAYSCHRATARTRRLSCAGWDR